MAEEIKKQEETPKISDEKIISLLSYIGLLCLIPLLAKRESKFAQFHAKQGLILCLGWVISWIPFIGWLLWIILVIFSVWGVINVINGKYAKLPLVGDLAEKLNI